MENVFDEVLASTADTDVTTDEGVSASTDTSE